MLYGKPTLNSTWCLLSYFQPRNKWGKLVVYIHKNPQKHGFVSDFREWPYSSYESLISMAQSHLKKEETLGWFSGTNGLIQAHLIPEIWDTVQYLIDGDE